MDECDEGDESDGDGSHAAIILLMRWAMWSYALRPIIAMRMP